MFTGIVTGVGVVWALAAAAPEVAIEGLEGDAAGILVDVAPVSFQVL